MDGILQIALLLMLTASLMLQFCAVFIAFRLMRFSGRSPAWILICAAAALMTLRRAVTFYHLLAGGLHHLPDLYAEVIAFFTSLVLVTGLLAIRPLMRRIYGQPDPDAVSAGELFETIPSGIAVYEAVDRGRDFIIRDINPAAERIEKIARQHATGRRLSEVLPRIEEFGLPDVLRRVWKTGRPESFPMHYYQDSRISGWRDYFVYRRVHGEIVAVYEDVSGQMHMQEELERRERKFRLLFEKAPLPYQILDDNGRILEVNPAWLHLTGLASPAEVDRPFSELLTRTGRQKFQEFLSGLNKTGTLHRAALELRRKDGVVLNVEMEALPVRGGTGGATQIYCTLCEADGRKMFGGADADAGRQALARAEGMLAGERRELQRRRLAMFGELTAGMAHEINTPLTAARNAFNLMREGLTPSSPHYEFAAIASRELARMADMVEQMYRFHEPVPQTCEALDINALLDNALILVRNRMRERRIQLRDERAGIVPLVLLPPGAVMLTLIQPVKNSIEAMSENGILTLRTGSETGGGVFVEIEDNGPGIPPEFLPHLFEPFTTFRHSGTGGGGIGLGMAMVRRTLDVLGGTVTVHSSEGSGTCVRIILPARMEVSGQGV